MRELISSIKSGLKNNTGAVLFVGFWTAYFLLLWGRSIIRQPDGAVIAGHSILWSDWALHFTFGSVIAWRDLFPWESPLLIGAPFTYPYAFDFLSGVLVRFGFPYFASFVVPSLIASIALAVILLVFYKRIFQSLKTAIFASFLFFFNGGVGFIYFFKDVAASATPLKTFFLPSRSYTRIDSAGIYWMSVIDSMMVPQRSFTAGFPLGLLILLVLWRSIHSESPRLPLWTAVLYGLLPVVHAHTFFAVGLITGWWALVHLLTYDKEDWFQWARSWLIYILTASAVALPLIFSFILRGRDGGTLLTWKPGWYAAELRMPWISFWLRNWGIVPLAALAGCAGLWKRLGDRQKMDVVYLAVPMAVLFVLINLIIFQPWIWDNTKILVWSALFVCGFAGVALDRLSEKSKIIAGLLFSVMIASGVIDAYRILLPKINRVDMFSGTDLKLAKWVRENTEPRSIWASSTHPNSWAICLTGRQTMMAYEGWLWSHGYKYMDVKTDLMNIYNNPDGTNVFKRYNVDYVVVSPWERRDFKADDAKFRTRFPVLISDGNTTVYATNAGRYPGGPWEPVSEKFLKPARRTGFGLDAGLRGLTFNDPYFFSPKEEKIHQEIPEFNYDASAPRPFTSPVSMEYTGYLYVSKKGPYLFSLESDDGSWLILNDRLVIDNGGEHSTIDKRASVNLEKGYHRIKIRYFDAFGGAVFKVRWGETDDSLKPVDPQNLFH